MTDMRQGYQEIAHTADWSLAVWAPDLAGLFNQAAVGMYALMQMEIDPQDEIIRDFTIESIDKETLLVDFLGELLYLGEMEGLAFHGFDLSLDVPHLQARVQGGRILSQSKEIKAVTFHNLVIRQTDGLYRTTIVFDV